MRIILKYGELTEVGKKNRYKALFVLPSFAVLILLLSKNFSYIFISLVVVAFILIELIIFGLMDTKYHYTLGDFMKDTVFLIISIVIITYFVGPRLLLLLTGRMNLSEAVLNGLQFFVSMLLLYGAWFSIILTQSRIRKRSEEWKWQVTGLFSNEKSRVNAK